MQNILSNVSMTNINTNATDVLIAVKPFLVFLLGLILAFFVLRSLIEFISKKKN